MPLWGWILLGALGIALVAAAVAAGYFGWKAIERRALVRLVGRAEGVEAMRLALVATVTRLVEEPEALETFASDASSSERRALAEVQSRSAMLADELDRVSVPHAFVPTAEALADAAFVIAKESSRVGDTDTGDEVFDALAMIDLSAVNAYADRARDLIRSVCDACGLEETAVYGGGLYL